MREEKDDKKKGGGERGTRREKGGWFIYKLFSLGSGRKRAKSKENKMEEGRRGEENVLGCLKIYIRCILPNLKITRKFMLHAKIIYL